MTVPDRVGDLGTSWLTPEGPEAGIVLSTRVRVARNLQGFPFSVRAGEEARRRILEQIREVLPEAASLGEVELWRMEELEPRDRRILLERHLVSQELAGAGNGGHPQGAALAVSRSAPLSVMINEEDHLRLQTLRSGLQLARAWQDVDRLDDEIGARLPYAFHHEFGFLTSCPTNVGTGLRASVLIHLPGLVLTKEIQKVLQGISQVGLTFRGLYGEGSEVVGNFFQISNQTTLGKNEGDLVDHLEKIVGQVIQYEKHARSLLLREAPSVLEDKVWRAYGILRHSRSIAFDEMMNLLSGLRLGLTLKLLKSPRVETLNRTMIYAQNSHLERGAGRALDEIDADVYRASRVREALARDEGEDGGQASADPRPDESDGTS